MSSIMRIRAIFMKQVKDTLKNKAVLIQFIMFPVMTLVMANTVQIKDMKENFFVIMFATMYIGMAPLISMASIIAEEKEKNTLRILLMSNVSAVEYLLGVGLYIVIISIAGTCVIASQGHYQTKEFLLFLVTMLIGIIISTLVGAIIGICSKNQMSATSLTVPIMIVLSFLPMIASFNKSIGKVSQFIYSQQIDNMLHNVSGKVINNQGITVLVANALIVLIAFFVSFRKKGLEV